MIFYDFFCELGFSRGKLILDAFGVVIVRWYIDPVVLQAFALVLIVKTDHALA